MSGAPKRSHEEVVGGGHSSSSSKFPIDDATSHPKLPSAAPNDHLHPSDAGPDIRLPKIPRTESRDADRRSPMHSVYRIPSSSNDSHVDSHPGGASETRVEPKDSKDGREHRVVETRDLKIDARELYVEPKRDPQTAKLDKDARLETRADDQKETKFDREAYNDPRNDAKTDKEALGSTAGQSNWKESKEYHRGKRFNESPGGHVDPWHPSRANTQGLLDIGKESSTIEERDCVEANEAVGENKVDLKVEDRFKDKDRKRKDAKHREWGDRDKEKERNDHKSNVQIGNTSSDGKELSREDREAEKWEREKKDITKDRDRPKDREKEHSKRESWNGGEKEGVQTEKECADGSVRVSEQEIPTSDQKKQKDLDSWKNVDRETRDRRKDREIDTETERPEKRSRLYDKELDDGFADGEGASEKEREVFNSGVQQRKRMLRPRGSPQVANREPRFRSRPQDSDGSQAAGASGKPEVSSVVYKVGECMQDLLKLWKEYEASQSDKNSESNHNGPTLEIRIPAEHVTATNRQVRGGQLWGTDIYTDDSDLVAVLMHTGYCRPTASPPPSTIQELRATVRVLPPQDSYTSMLRNNVRSRAWGAGIGCSYRVEHCCIVKKGGGTIDLEPCLTHTSAVEPTLAPVAVERTMTTRAAASNALRQQRFVREVTIQYNLCNEPWIKYSISVVADKGLKKPLYTSARLKKGEVLYLETHSCRYELCFTGEKMVKAVHLHEESEKSHHPHASNSEKNDSDNTLIDIFRWSRCKKPLPQKVMRSVGIPLPLEYVEVLEENLDWEDVQWSQTGVWISGKEYVLARVHFLSPN